MIHFLFAHLKTAHHSQSARVVKGVDLRSTANRMADTFTCSGFVPHAFYKSGTWLLDYVLKSTWPNGQGVGPLIQRLWFKSHWGCLLTLTHRFSSGSQTGASSLIAQRFLDRNQALLFFLPPLQNGAHYGTSGHGRRYDTSGHGLRTRDLLF